MDVLRRRVRRDDEPLSLRRRPTPRRSPQGDLATRTSPRLPPSPNDGYSPSPPNSSPPGPPASARPSKRSSPSRRLPGTVGRSPTRPRSATPPATPAKPKKGPCPPLPSTPPPSWPTRPRPMGSRQTEPSNSGLTTRSVGRGHRSAPRVRRLAERSGGPPRHDGSVPSAPRVAPGGRHLVAPPLGWWRAIGRPHRHQRK